MFYGSSSLNMYYTYFMRVLLFSAADGWGFEWEGHCWSASRDEQLPYRDQVSDINIVGSWADGTWKNIDSVASKCLDCCKNHVCVGSYVCSEIARWKRNVTWYAMSSNCGRRSRDCALIRSSPAPLSSCRSSRTHQIDPLYLLHCPLIACCFLQLEFLILLVAEFSQGTIWIRNCWCRYLVSLLY